MRWNAEGVVEAARREGMPVGADAERYAALVAADPGHLAQGAAEWAAEEELASAAVLTALRRHGRAPTPSEQPRPLTDVTLLVGSGGVLRHAPEASGSRVLDRALADHAGGWRVPARADAVVDRAYLLFAVGLLGDHHPAAARALAERLGAGPRREDRRVLGVSDPWGPAGDFDPDGTYVNTASLGLPPRVTAEALDDVHARWRRGHVQATDFDPVVADARADLRAGSSASTRRPSRSGTRSRRSWGWWRRRCRPAPPCSSPRATSPA